MTSVRAIISAIGPWLRGRVKWASEKGASAVEYGILASLIAAVIITAVVYLGDRTERNYDCTANSIEARSDAC